MILRNDLVQGSPEWLLARLGIPTASHFDKILTPKKLQPSTQAVKYQNHLIAEWLLGYPLEFGGYGQNGGGWMDRGGKLEAEARRAYELRHDVDVELIGFVLRDDEKVGGSPDGFVGDDGGVEIKVPALHTLIGYIINPQSLVDDYFAQCQGYMYLTGRAWWDVFAYSPKLPAVERRIERDERYITPLGNALDAFVMSLDAHKERLAEYKYEPEPMAAE